MKKLSVIEGESHGGGPVVFSWQPGGNYLATAGKNGVAHVFDHHGQKVDDVIIPGEAAAAASNILCLEWDCNGEVLAILSEGNVAIYMWEASHRRTRRLDTKMPNLSFMAWSRKGSRLVVGNEHGNVLIYNHETRKKTRGLGKHPHRISCGAWGKGSMLALGSEDGTITLRNEVGDTLDQAELMCSPAKMHFSGIGGRDDDDGMNDDMFLSVETTGGRSLLLYKVKDLDSKIELTFQRVYGDVTCHMWLRNGQLAIGFRKGYIVIVSTNVNEIGQEQFSGRIDGKRLISASYSRVNNCLAMASEKGLKIINVHKYKEIVNSSVATLDLRNLRITALSWSSDGTILTIAVENGHFHNFNDNRTRPPMLHASYGTHLAYLSSNLCEVNVVYGAHHANSSLKIPPRSITIPLMIEPSFIALGGAYVAAGTNTRVLYYRAQPHDRSCVREKNYLRHINDIRLNGNNFVAVLCGGEVMLHIIEVDAAIASEEERKSSTDVTVVTPFEEITFSRDSLNGTTITAISLTDDLLAYGTMEGEINLFHLQEWCPLIHINARSLNLKPPIRSLCPDYLGIRQLVTDDVGMGYIYSPATGSVVTIPEFPSNTVVVASFWDQQDRHVFFIADSEDYIHTYAYTSLSAQGELVTKLGKTELTDGGSISIVGEATLMPTGHKPILSAGGTITCQVNDGTLATFVAAPYADIQKSMDSNASLSTRRACIMQNLALLRFQHAWRSAVKLDERALYVALGNRALEIMDIQTAINVYRQLGDAGMVMTLETIEDIEDKNLLAGHILQLFGKFYESEKLFLKSSTPKAALTMRMNLLQWDQALNLARELDPQSCPGISAELRRQLENCGEYDGALRAYKNSLKGKFSTTTSDDADILTEKMKHVELELHHLSLPAVDNLSKEQTFSCMAGVARCSLWLGDVYHGIRIAEQLGSEQLIKECAKILEALKQISEAAALWEKINRAEQAASIYIRMKSIDKAASVMHSVKRPKLLLQYAKLCESMDRWQEAANAYERADDLDSAVHLYLKKLNQPDRACRIVRGTSFSITRALMVTSYYEERHQWREVMEYLIMAECSDKALELAIRENKMESFTDLVGDSISPGCAASIAQYYEALKVDIPKYDRALSLFLQCGGDKHVLDAAIDIVGKARNDKLTQDLTNFLMGDTDGVPKDPNYIYKLHMALENYTEAAKAAMAIAAKQQKLGNYQVAHRMLYDTIHLLEMHHMDVPHSMRQKFVLIHSYVLAKSLVNRGDHEGAARMLIRVAKSISEFPNHVVPILTSTIIECQRAGLKKSAYEHAIILTSPEYRSKIDKKFKRNIEALVRHPVFIQAPELLTQCPISGELIPATQLECPTSRNNTVLLPMCIITGHHMERGDWCICPASGMPALMSHYQEYLRWESMNGVSESTTTRDGQVNELPPQHGSHEGGVSGHDPILGKLVCSLELRRCSSSEISETIQYYNRKDGDEEKCDIIESSGEPTEPPSIAFAD